VHAGVPHESRPGGRVCKVWDLAATSRSVRERADHLAGEGIEVVTVESTSDYWRIFFYLLERDVLAWPDGFCYGG
jgi:transposase